MTPGILPFTLRASLRLFKIAPGDFVEPLDSLARLAALVPSPRVNLARLHGVFAPHSPHRIPVTPAKRGKGRKRPTADEQRCPSPPERRASMTWAQRLKRVFHIDMETCSTCGGVVRVIACIEDPVVIDKILTHLEKKAVWAEPVVWAQSRAPPQRNLFDGFSVQPRHDSRNGNR